MLNLTSAGERRNQIKLLNHNDAQDRFGQSTGFTEYATVWAFIETLQGNETFQGMQFTSEVSHRVNIRYAPSLHPKSKDRVQYGSRTFDIKAVLNRDERNIEFDLLCLELADGTAAGA